MTIRVGIEENSYVKLKWQEIETKTQKIFADLLKDFKDTPATVYFNYPDGALLRDIVVYADDKIVVTIQIRKDTERYLESIFKFLGDNVELEHHAIVSYSFALSSYKHAELYKLVEATWEDSLGMTNISVVKYGSLNDYVLEITGNCDESELIKRFISGTTAFDAYWQMHVKLNDSRNQTNRKLEI